MKLKFSKEIYAKEAIIKAAYFYTDKYYMELDADNTYFYVELSAKEQEETNLEKDFMNEVLIQTTRLNISSQTKNVREMIIGRALASTIIDNKDTGFVDDDNINSEDILNNWFDVNE